MQRKMVWKYATLVFVACLLCGSYATAQLAAALASTPTDYRGNCPGVITFKGTITSTKAQAITYIFTRSDGAIDTNPKKLIFRRPGKLRVANETWTLGGDGLPYYKGWEAIKIIKPRLVMSRPATFELRCNPPAWSVSAAHGNTDWHIDTANEFLFGKNMAGTTTASHHAPDTWTRSHIHVGLTNTSKYYYDKATLSTGEDTNNPNGIDRPMLFFYAGHGNPTLWSALGEYASQASVRLANVEGGGVLRYYWQCSCEVFAHGPETCTPATTFGYACPDKFTGGADSASMRNVFQRWGPALTSDLRMACGGSTEMYCHTQEVDRAWSDYGSGSIAHMFLDGFGENNAYGVVPLCMTLGGTDVTKTPLYDIEFTNAPNTSGRSHYYLMYPTGTQSSATSELSPSRLPGHLSTFKVTTAPTPSQLMPLLENPAATAQITSSLIAGGKAKISRTPQTGALRLDSGKVANPSLQSLSEQEYSRRAMAFLVEQGWQEQQMSQPEISRYMIMSVPVNGERSAARETQAGVTIHYKRIIPVDGVPVEVLGTAGMIRVHLNNDGHVLNALKHWRKLEPIGSPAPVRSFETAKEDATRKLTTADAYRLSQWKLAYKLEIGVNGEEQLTPVYQFAFVAVKAHDMEHAPQLIEVQATQR